MTTLMQLLENAGVKDSVQWGTKIYRQGEVIVEENSPGSEMFLIGSGSVHIFLAVQVTQERSEDRGIAKLSSGDFFGEIALFSNDLRTATVVAATDCEITMIDGASLLDFMDAHPDKGYPIMRFLFETMMDRVRHVSLRASTLMSFYLREHSDDLEKL
jgi:CRP/FNR family cyclic AMP-dependent transcriptional regulator